MEILPITPRDIEQITRIYARVFDPCGWCARYLSALIRRPLFMGIKVESQDGEIIGMWLSSEGVHLSYPNAELYQRIARRVTGYRVYTGHGLYVSPEHRRKGIAKALCARADAELKKRGAQILLGELVTDPSGKKPGEMAMLTWPPLEHFGVYQLYNAIHEENEPPCVVCGQLPCRCTADIYLMRIDREGDLSV